MRRVSLLADYPKRRWTRPRPVAVGRRTIVVGALTLAVLASWSAASVWYFVSRDEVTLKLLEKQAAQKRLYEDKVAALQAKLEQVSSQRLVEHEVLEGRLKVLLARQAAFESRQAQVDLLVTERTGSVEPKLTPAKPVEASAAPAPSFLPDFFQLRLGPAEAPAERHSRLDEVKRDLDRASLSLAALETEQVRTLHTVATDAESRGRKLQSAIRRAGLDPIVFEPEAQNTGGPFVPADASGRPFETVLQRAQTSLIRLQHLRRSVTALPFGEPINGEIDLSSGFGVRADPFTRAPAMHTGLDFRAEYGAAVRAAGAGRVVAAEFSGAYGNMVDVEHVGGVTSRYAHLSSIAVNVGQEVKAGTVLGRVGSTGRSTGPHLHYETRLNGEAVDPQRFLKAGATLSAAVVSNR